MHEQTWTPVRIWSELRQWLNLGRSCQYAVFPADGRFFLQAPIVFCCHLSSDQPSVACFSGCWPKDLEHPARGCNIFPVWIHLSPPAQNVAFQEVFRTSSSDIDCVLTFSLCLFVPALRRFCRLRTTIWYDMIWYESSSIHVQFWTASVQRKWSSSLYGFKGRFFNRQLK